MKPVILTDDERDLLREWPRFVEDVIVDPAYGVQGIREQRGSGGGFGRNFHVGGNRITATWSHYEVLERYGPNPDRPHLEGTVKHMRIDDPHREVHITLPRLQRWAEQLPDSIRRRAFAARHPDTRDRDELRRIALEAIDLGIAVTPPAGEQLDLFGEVA